MTLYERVTGWLYFQQEKHGFKDSYVEDHINQMTNYELLKAISEALEEQESGDE